MACLLGSRDSRSAPDPGADGPDLANPQLLPIAAYEVVCLLKARETRLVAIRVRLAALVADGTDAGIGWNAAHIVDAHGSARAARGVGELTALGTITAGEILRNCADAPGTGRARRASAASRLATTIGRWRAAAASVKKSNQSDQNNLSHFSFADCTARRVQSARS